MARACLHAPTSVLLSALVLTACGRESDRARGSSSPAAHQAAPCPTLDQHRDAAAQRTLNVLPNANVSGIYTLGPERVLTASMRTDLRHLVTAEESFFADHGTYTTDLRALNFRPLPGIDILILAADSIGLNATTRSCLARTWCAISVGMGNQLLQYQFTDGDPVCET